jgi:hypothetical protein
MKRLDTECLTSIAPISHTHHRIYTDTHITHPIQPALAAPKLRRSAPKPYLPHHPSHSTFYDRMFTIHFSFVKLIPGKRLCPRELDKRGKRSLRGLV